MLCNLSCLVKVDLKGKGDPQMSDFEPVWARDFGMCSSIFPQLPFNESLKNESTHEKWTKYAKDIIPGAKAGSLQGLFIYIDTEGWDFRYTTYSHSGIRLTIHHHLDVPFNIVDGISLAAGYTHSIAVTPKIYRTTEEAITRFSPEDRQCYEDSDLEFKYLKPPYRTSMRNCLYEASVDAVIERCKCSPNYIKEIPNISPCQGVQLNCVLNMTTTLGTITKVTGNHLNILNVGVKRVMSSGQC